MVAAPAALAEGADADAVLAVVALHAALGLLPLGDEVDLRVPLEELVRVPRLVRRRPLVGSAIGQAGGVQSLQ